MFTSDINEMDLNQRTSVPSALVVIEAGNEHYALSVVSDVVVGRDVKG
jgi:hypothetical protein